MIETPSSIRRKGTFRNQDKVWDHTGEDGMRKRSFTPKQGLSKKLTWLFFFFFGLFRVF